jgi:hypothetical protein
MTARRMWEISENLHRAELPQLERDKLVAEWCRLVGKTVSAQVAPKPQGGRPEGGVREAARQLGLDRDDVRRAVKVASLSDAAQKTAVQLGLDFLRVEPPTEKGLTAFTVSPCNSWSG